MSSITEQVTKCSRASSPRPAAATSISENKNEAPSTTDAKELTPSTASTVVWIVIMCFSQLAMYVCGKRAMQAARFPTLLCLAQFGLSAVLTLVPSPLTGDGWRAIKIARRPHLRALVPLCLLWGYAFVLLNAGISVMSASMATAVRATEPLSAVMLGLLVFKENYSVRLVATLAPICGGVAMTTYGGGSLTVFGFVLTWLSNFGFASRPFLARMLAQTPGEKLDDSSVYFNVCALSSVALLPAFLVLESTSAFAAAYTLSAEQRGSFLQNLALSSIGFFFYQFAQLVLMSRLSNITFSVVTPLSKAFVTVFCAFYFGDTMSAFNISGIGVSTFGVLLFSYAKRKDTEKAAAQKQVQKPAGGKKKD